MGHGLPSGAEEEPIIKPPRMPKLTQQVNVNHTTCHAFSGKKVKKK